MDARANERRQAAEARLKAVRERVQAATLRQAEKRKKAAAHPPETELRPAKEELSPRPNPKVGGSNSPPATTKSPKIRHNLGALHFDGEGRLRPPCAWNSFPILTNYTTFGP